MNVLLPVIRRNRIVDEVHRHGAADVAELAQALGVSTTTIRRDIQELAAGGRLRKVHGGAVPSSAWAVPRPRH